MEILLRQFSEIPSGQVLILYVTNSHSLEDVIAGSKMFGLKMFQLVFSLNLDHSKIFYKNVHPTPSLSIINDTNNINQKGIGHTYQNMYNVTWSRNTQRGPIDRVKVKIETFI